MPQTKEAPAAVAQIWHRDPAVRILIGGLAVLLALLILVATFAGGFLAGSFMNRARAPRFDDYRTGSPMMRDRTGGPRRRATSRPVKRWSPPVSETATP